MCVIIHLPPRVNLNKNTLQNCYENNPDGFGIMSGGSNVLQMTQSVGNFDTFLREFKEYSPEVPRAIHFRWRTHGLINRANCHPFKITEQVGMMHNGMIKTVEKNKDMSDTWHFVEYELKPMFERWPNLVDDDLLMNLVSKITESSRLLFMDDQGKTTRTQNWHQYQGAFLSNSSSHNSSYRGNSGKKSKKSGGGWKFGDDWGDDYGSYNYKSTYGEYKNGNWIPNDTASVAKNLADMKLIANQKEAKEKGNETECKIVDSKIVPIKETVAPSTGPVTKPPVSLTSTEEAQKAVSEYLKKSVLAGGKSPEIEEVASATVGESLSSPAPLPALSNSGRGLKTIQHYSDLRPYGRSEVLDELDADELELVETEGDSYYERKYGPAPQDVDSDFLNGGSSSLSDGLGDGEIPVIPELHGMTWVELSEWATQNKVSPDELAIMLNLSKKSA